MADQEVVDLASLVKRVNDETKTNLLHLAGEGVNEVTQWIPTGWTLLDLALCGGIPMGRLIELFGLESSGKSTVCYQVLRNVQRAGGVAIYFDVENTYQRQLAQKMGIDTDRLIVVQDGLLLDGDRSAFSYISSIMKALRSEEPTAPLVIVWDTIAATLTKGEKDGDASAALGPYRARIIREGLRTLPSKMAAANTSLILVNHVGVKINSGGPGGGWGGPQYDTSGGRGPKYYASVRIGLRVGSLIKNDAEVPVGQEIVAKVEKLKLGAPRREAKGRLYFGDGIDDAYSLFDYLKDAGVIKQSGAWSQIPSPSGAVVKTYPSKLREALAANPGLYEHMQKLATEKFESDT